MSEHELVLHPDRLFPAEPGVRARARSIFSAIESLPVVSPHGHLDARLFRDNRPFADPAALLIQSDHYVVRLLHAWGVPLPELGLRPRDGGGDRPSWREVWRWLCVHWSALAGTPSRLWLEHELVELFGVGVVPCAENADELYDTCTAALQRDELLPRSLYRRFGIEVLTTTDSPLDDLSVHETLAEDPSWKGRLLPTFRPDEVVDPSNARFLANLSRLAEVAKVDTATYDGYLEALRSRRQAFKAAGATASDHGVSVTSTERLEYADAARLYDRLLKNDASASEIEAFRGHMVNELAGMAVDDGLVMQVHTGVARDYGARTAELYGPDIGQDFPIATEFTRTLRPLLARYGDHPGFRLVLYTVDETTFSREIGPLVSYFPSLWAGAPWWFLDAPDAMARAFTALGETAGIAKLAGFVDDTRSLCGIGARHDVARRVLAGYLARLVGEHRLGEDEAVELATDYAYRRPKELFNV